LYTELLATVKIDVLKDFYKSPDGRNGEEGWFKLSFQNYAGITYCEDAAKKCVNGMLTREIGRLN